MAMMESPNFRNWLGALGFALCLITLPMNAQEAGRATIVEDRAAKKLLEAGDARLVADEADKAVEIWESVLERYPASRHRFEARARLGEYLLENKRAFDEARLHFEVASSDENADDEARAHAMLKVGECLFESRDYSRAFSVLRDVIEQYPASEEVNHAYHFIGLGHFRQGHYSRAIEALEKVGTAFSENDARLDRIEAGRRLFVRIDDRDLSTLDLEEVVRVTCRSQAGDEEKVDAVPIGRDATLAIGSIATRLGPAVPGNGILEVKGGDRIKMIYTDEHTSDMKFNQQREVGVTVVGTAQAQILDGQFAEPLGGVVVGRSANLQITDADGDRSPGVDRIRAAVEVYRRKTDRELEDETAALIAKGTQQEDIDVDLWRRIDRLDIDLTEAVKTAPKHEEQAPSTNPLPTHSPYFQVRVPIVMADEPKDGGKLEARPGDQIRLIYRDETNLLNQPVDRIASAACIEGDLGDVRVSKTQISDRELQIKTSLRTAAALANIGNQYRDFGLADPAEAKYSEAVDVCNSLLPEARRIGGSLLEESYVQLWRIYFAMDEHGRATSMANLLQREFPESAFIDEAVLQQADVARATNDLDRAIVLYRQIVGLKSSDRRGDAQFGIAQCYEAKALAAGAEKGKAMFDKAFEEYKRVYEEHSDSPKVGEAVAKMANFYYQKKDYARAVDVFENVLSDHPDAGFLDVILYNYGRCLFRLDRKAEAQRQFDQLIAEYPESKLANEAKRISDALRKQAAPAPTPGE